MHLYYSLTAAVYVGIGVDSLLRPGCLEDLPIFFELMFSPQISFTITVFCICMIIPYKD